MSYIKAMYNLKLLQISDNNEKYYICKICSNNNDESIEVVISVSVSELVLFIADISVIRILFNLLIGAPLMQTQNGYTCNTTHMYTWQTQKYNFTCGINHLYKPASTISWNMLNLSIMLMV